MDDSALRAYALHATGCLVVSSSGPTDGNLNAHRPLQVQGSAVRGVFRCGGSGSLQILSGPVQGLGVILLFKLVQQVQLYKL